MFIFLTGGRNHFDILYHHLPVSNQMELITCRVALIQSSNKTFATAHSYQHKSAPWHTARRKIARPIKATQVSNKSIHTVFCT
jgi:acyl-CoA thioesterase